MTSSDIKHYRCGPRYRRRIQYASALMMALPLVLALLAVPFDDTALFVTAGITALIVAPFVVYMLWTIGQRRLALSADGLAVSTLSSAGYIPWSNIARLWAAPGSEGIELHEPIAATLSSAEREFGTVRFFGQSLYDDTQRELLAAGRFVNLKSFDDRLADPSFIADIERFAPHLVDDLKGQLSSAPTVRANQKRVLRWVVVASLALGALGVALGLYDPSPPDAEPSPGVARFESALLVAIALAFAVHAIANLRAAWSRARARRYGIAAFWAILGAVQIALALAFLSGAQ